MIAGELHPFRVDPGAWKGLLAAVAKLGFDAVDCPVPWVLHQPSPTSFEWTGALDLDRFLDLAAAEGLAVVLRPGPHLGRELPGLGVPDWILEDGSLLARTAGGTPALWPFPPRMTPLPSYASNVFRARTRAWFDEVARVVRGRGAQIVVDHDLGVPERSSAFDLDYHAEALEQWAETHSGEPPRRAGDDRAALEWVRFRRHMVLSAEAWLVGAARDAGLGDALAVGAAAPTLFGVTSFQQPALSAYGDGEALPDLIHRLQRGGVGRATAPTSITAGGSPMLRERRPADDVSHLAAALAAGARSISVHMAVERERWYGAWIDGDGAVTEHGRKMRSVLAALRAAEHPRWQRQDAIAVLRTRADLDWAQATSALAPLPPTLARVVGASPLDLARDGEAREKDRWYPVLYRALRLAQIPHREIDEAVDNPGVVRAVIVPTLERVSNELWDKLHRWAESGVQVVIGPSRPSRDEDGEPLARAQLPRHTGLLRGESLGDEGSLADDLLGIAGELEDAWIAPDEGEVECVPLRVDAEVRALVVVNHGTEREVELALPGDQRLRDPYSGEDLRASARGAAQVSLRRRQVRLFVSSE